MNDWIAFYYYPLSESNPLAAAIHSWESSGQDPEEALQNLEKNYSVPFSIFLLEIVPAVKAQEWLEEHRKSCENLDVPFIYNPHGRG